MEPRVSEVWAGRVWGVKYMDIDMDMDMVLTPHVTPIEKVGGSSLPRGDARGEGGYGWNGPSLRFTPPNGLFLYPHRELHDHDGASPPRHSHRPHSSHQ